MVGSQQCAVGGRPSGVWSLELAARTILLTADPRLRTPDCGSVEPLRNGKSERCDRRVERYAVIAHHLIAAMHAAHRCLDGGCAGEAKGFTGREVRMLADHTRAAH